MVTDWEFLLTIVLNLEDLLEFEMETKTLHERYP